LVLKEEGNMIALIWGKLQSTLAAILMVVGAIVSAWLVGRKTGVERARAQAAEQEQNARRSADEAARTAQQSTAADRLRGGKF
jgi:hypothetical protein